MYIQINIKKQPDAPENEQYIAQAYTEGIGIKYHTEYHEQKRCDQSNNRRQIQKNHHPL